MTRGWRVGQSRLGNVVRVTTKLTVRAGVLVGLDAGRVWDLAVDWTRQREWILATTTTGGHGLGATVTGRTGFGPIGFTDPMEITEWAPPVRCTLTHLGKVVRGQGMFEVLPSGDRLRGEVPSGDVPSGDVSSGDVPSRDVSSGGRLRGDAGGVEFRWTERIELPLPPAIGKLVAAALIAPLTRLGLAWSLRRFARLANRLS